MEKEELKKKLKEKQEYEKKVRVELYAVIAQIALLKELLGEGETNGAENNV